MNFGTNEFTLLSEEQVFGDHKIKYLGGKCAITDFAILLGGYVSKNEHVGSSISLKDRTGWWYLSSSDNDGDVCSVQENGNRICTNAGKRFGCIRPVLPFSSISDISSKAVRRKGAFLEVEYGEYPQYAVDDVSIKRALYREFEARKLKKTGKYYTTDSRSSRRWYSESMSFKEKKHYEYEYEGKKYVRVKSNCCEGDCKLSDGARIWPNEIVWVEVAPITWLVDENAKLLVSKTLLASGIRFCNNGLYRDDFKSTEVYMFLNKYFAKDIGHIVIPEIKPEEKTPDVEDKKIQSLNLKNFILQSIDNLVVNQIYSLEPEEQKKYLKETQEILNDYINGMKNLSNQDSDEINIDIENFEKIRLDALDRIIDIKERIEETNQKNTLLKELTIESKLLNDRLEELSQLNTEQNKSLYKSQSQII